ncbi:MAG: hypothetical protein Q7N50_14800, partial [Armatimonadota bacterium]|nr:hypothetical protein [Armatimonadota bacterium]
MGTLRDKNFLSDIQVSNPRKRREDRLSATGTVISVSGGEVEINTGAVLPDGTPQYMSIPLADGFSPEVGKMVGIAYLNNQPNGAYAYSIGQSAGSAPVAGTHDITEHTFTGGSISKYLRGDGVLATLNQAAVAGLTTTDSPAFAGLSVGALSGLIKGAAGVLSAVTEANYLNSTLIAANNAWTGTNDFQNAAGITLGKDDATNVAGVIKMFSAGANAFYSTFTAGTQTANAAYVLPTARPTGASFLKGSSADPSVLSWDTAVYLTAEADTWATVMARGAQSDTAAIIQKTATEAFLVRKDADAGDVFVVDTTNGGVGINVSPGGNVLNIRPAAAMASQSLLNMNATGALAFTGMNITAINASFETAVAAATGSGSALAGANITAYQYATASHSSGLQTISATGITFQVEHGSVSHAHTGTATLNVDARGAQFIAVDSAEYASARPSTITVTGGYFAAQANAVIMSGAGTLTVTYRAGHFACFPNYLNYYPAGTINLTAIGADVDL